MQATGLPEMLLAFYEEDVPISFDSNKAQKLLLTGIQLVQRAAQDWPPSHAFRTIKVSDDYPILKICLRFSHLIQCTG